MHRILPSIFVILVLVLQSSFVFAQSQALDAQIEGSVTDNNDNAVPSSVVTAINQNTGLRRTVRTNGEGIFRLPILTIGIYTITVENEGFRRSERRGVYLSAGQTATINFRLEPGSPNETVTVTSDTAIADPAKTEIGKTINAREIRGLSLVSRNPLNFILLQPGTNGRTFDGPNVIALNVNGLRRRVGYQLDGSYNNSPGLGGFRFDLLSEVFIQEIQLLSNGYSAEFGNTAGAIVNVITRSGTNDLNGSATFLWRPTGLSATQFGEPPGSKAGVIDGVGFATTVGGPIIKDRWHFYLGYEWTRRVTTAAIKISEPDKASFIATGFSPSIFESSEPNFDYFPYLLVRTDAVLSKNMRVSLRYNRFDANTKNLGTGGTNSGGSVNTTERSYDWKGFDHAFGAQLVTNFSDTFFNEFRVHYAKRILNSFANDLSSDGISVNISNSAAFGRNPAIGTVSPNESTLEFENVVSKVLGRHSFKAGGGLNFISLRPKEEDSSTYSFPTVPTYLNALNGTDLRGYSQYTETFGDTDIPYGSTFLSLFAQDDWKMTPRLKLAIGLRYDLYKPPDADPSSPLPFSQKFRTDKDNFAPRFGLSYLVREGRFRTIIRAGSGAYYDPPFLNAYRRAVLNNGNPRYFSFTFTPGTPGAPDFPNTLRGLPAGNTPGRDIDGIAPEFSTMYAVNSNLQVEQALSENVSITGGYLYTAARHIPVSRSMNCLPVGALADGRPKYGTTSAACARRIYPQFNLIRIYESAGNLAYHGVFVQLNKRFSRGYQLSSSYTFSRARDDAPEEFGPGSIVLSDPSNRRTDSGTSFGDVRHNFNLSFVATPHFALSNRILRAISNNNQLGVMILADSGEPFNINTADINRDGFSGDRPVGVSRNAGRLPAFLGVDARISRRFLFRENRSLQVFLEGTNIFNQKFVSNYRGTTLPASTPTSIVNPDTGELRGPLPHFGESDANWRPSRQLQFGVKVSF